MIPFDGFTLGVMLFAFFKMVFFIFFLRDVFKLAVGIFVNKKKTGKKSSEVLKIKVYFINYHSYLVLS